MTVLANAGPATLIAAAAAATPSNRLIYLLSRSLAVGGGGGGRPSFSAAMPISARLAIVTGRPS